MQLRILGAVLMLLLLLHLVIGRGLVVHHIFTVILYMPKALKFDTKLNMQFLQERFTLFVMWSQLDFVRV